MAVTPKPGLLQCIVTSVVGQKREHESHTTAIIRPASTGVSWMAGRAENVLQLAANDTRNVGAALTRWCPTVPAWSGNF